MYSSNFKNFLKNCNHTVCEKRELRIVHKYYINKKSAFLPKH